MVSEVYKNLKKKKTQHQYMNMFFGILTFFRMYI